MCNNYTAKLIILQATIFIPNFIKLITKHKKLAKKFEKWYNVAQNWEHKVSFNIKLIGLIQVLFKLKYSQNYVKYIKLKVTQRLQLKS